MATFTKDEIYALDPCRSWYPELVFQFPGDSATGAEMKAYMESKDGLDALPWLMAATIALATEFIEVTGETPNRIGAHGKVALHYAILNHDVAVITYLLSKGADKYIADDRGKTPMDMAYLSDDQAVIDAMGG